MTATNPTPQIPTLTTTALRLWARAKTSPLSALAPPTRSLATALKHLKFEAADPDSVLNGPREGVYLRQLGPVLEDCDFALRQVEAVLEKDERGLLGDEEREGVVRVVGRRLGGVRVGVELFLDTVQLQSGETDAVRAGEEEDREGAGGWGSGGGGGGGEGMRNLDDIKDKVDAIAKKIFARRDSGLGDDDDEDALWERFRDELVREGFAPEVLRKHKEVLRAYIRELESAETLDEGPVSVRGLLEQSARPAIMSQHHDPPPASPHELYAGENKRYLPPAEPPYPSGALATKHSDDDESTSSSPSRTLITTHDLMAPESPAQFNGMYVSPAVMQALQSQAPPPYSSPDAAPSYLSSPAPHAPPSSSPRFVPPLPSYAEGQRALRLRPDRNGREIPPDATWTRIRRELVSPVVLDRAGVRYEARPEFVAVLGVLSREEIREFARESAEVRRARAGWGRERRERREREREPDRGSESGSEWSESGDESESPPPVPRRPRADDGAAEKGTRSYPFIVQPPSDGEEVTSPASTVRPKPILKNKNENRVHFGPEPYETPAEGREDDEDEGRRRRRRRRREREYERDGERHHDRDRERDRDRDREREHRRRHGHGHGHGHRDRDRDRKRSGRDALYAAGLGGAAASLMSVLAEAAASL